MQIIGKAMEKGYSLEDLDSAMKKFENRGYICHMINLNEYAGIETEPARVLVVKKGADCLLEGTNANGRDLFE